MNAAMQQNHGILAGQQPAPASEIASQLGALENALDRVSRVQGLIRERLMPVSVGIPPKPPQPAMVAKALGSDMGRALNAFADRLNCIADALDDEVAALAI